MRVIALQLSSDIHQAMYSQDIDAVQQACPCSTSPSIFGLVHVMKEFAVHQSSAVVC